MFLSVDSRNRPRILMASTRSPDSDLIPEVQKFENVALVVKFLPIIVSTVSYKIAFPTFFEVSVFVATCAKISFISSEQLPSLEPRILKSLRSLS